MKTIGIKLADGSFYPVLDEGSAQEKKLELTTANNNQTKVMVDLYRSANCTMDDAEYVDSLQIENLVAHPNGEPDISFTVSIDEDNQLSAKIIDEETGNSSDTTITLVSRTLEERLVTDEYNISELDDSKTAAVAAGAGIGLMAAASAYRNSEEDSDRKATEEILSDSSEEIFEDIETDDSQAEVVTSEELEQNNTNSSEEEVEVVEESPFETAEETAVEETNLDLPDMDFDLEESAPAEENSFMENEDSATDDTTQEADIFATEETAETPATEENTFDLEDDFNISEDSATEENTFNIEDDFSMPEEPEKTDAGEESFDIGGASEIAEETSLDFDENQTSDLDEDLFAGMDFDATEENNFTNMDEDITTDDIFADMENDMKKDDNDIFDDDPVSGGISFTGLYDTENDYNDSADEEETKKKTKAPVIICIICAIICIIAVLLIFLVIPSDLNLLKKYKKTAEETPVEQPVEETPVEEPAPVVEEIPEAKEDEIIIIEKAEEVVPVQPPVVEKPKNTVYKIKWGDTLWDIADTYYKNPWKYKYIARYNGIKNPDHIVSGTEIIIPAE